MTELARVVTAAALTVTLFLARVTLATDSGGGLYWLPAGFVMAVFVAAVNVWVLLVEVVRSCRARHRLPRREWRRPGDLGQFNSERYRAVL